MGRLSREFAIVTLKELLIGCNKQRTCWLKTEGISRRRSTGAELAEDKMTDKDNSCMKSEHMIIQKALWILGLCIICVGQLSVYSWQLMLPVFFVMEWTWPVTVHEHVCLVTTKINISLVWSENSVGKSFGVFCF